MESRFALLWHQSGGTSAAAVFGRLAARYSGPCRSYHNITHIADCLSQLDTCGPDRHSSALELALWFHDVICDPRRKDNEAKSALIFAAEAGELPAGLVSQVSHLIHVTARHEASTTEEALLCDIDLSILGRDPATYQTYAAAIRQEYAWVTDPEWQRGRASVLQGFLARPVIYRTPTFRRLESRARSNLTIELAALETTNQDLL